MGTFKYPLLITPPSSQRRLGSSFGTEVASDESWIPAFAGMTGSRGEL